MELGGCSLFDAYGRLSFQKHWKYSERRIQRAREYQHGMLGSIEKNVGCEKGE